MDLGQRRVSDAGTGFVMLLSDAFGSVLKWKSQQDEERFAIKEPVRRPLDAALSEMDSTAFALLTSLAMTD